MDDIALTKEQLYEKRSYEALEAELWRELNNPYVNFFDKQTMKLLTKEEKELKVKNLIQKIKDYKIGIGDPYSLNEPCMSDEIPSYLKELPEKLAYDLGYYLSPAVKALKGDGLDENSIKRIIDWRLGKCSNLIKDLEAIRVRLNKDIYYEFDNFKLNRSELSELHRQALDILYDIFEDIKEFKTPLDEVNEDSNDEHLIYAVNAV
jgi:hypothetical protein